MTLVYTIRGFIGGCYTSGMIFSAIYNQLAPRISGIQLKFTERA